MSRIKTLQQKIEARAKSKLITDIRELKKQIKNSDVGMAYQKKPATLYLFREEDMWLMKDDEGQSHKVFRKQDRQFSFRYLEDIFGSTMESKLKEQLLPVYIDRETEKFMREFEELKTRVDELDADIEHYLQ